MLPLKHIARTSFRPKGPVHLPALLLRCAHDSRDKSSPLPPAWLQKFNDNISLNPVVTIPSYLFIRNSTWYGLVAVLTHLGLGGPEFAIGYLVSKVTAKFRQPLNLSIAALFLKIFPMLSHIKASSLLYIPMPKEEDKGIEADQKNKSQNDNVVSKVSGWIMAPLDKYGFSFYTAAKLTTFLTIGGTAILIRQGIDLSVLLESLGVSSTLQDVGGAAGLASMVNVGLIPGQLLLLGRVTPLINTLVATMPDTARGNGNNISSDSIKRSGSCGSDSDKV